MKMKMERGLTLMTLGGMISDEEDLFDVDVDDDSHGAGPSTVVPDRSKCQEGEQDRNERGE
jgi:hypothetical protein